MGSKPQSWPYRLVVAERRFLLALVAQLLLVSMLLHASVNGLIGLLSAQQARGPVAAPVDTVVFEILCWASFFLGLYCSLLFLRWAEAWLAGAAEAATGSELPRSILGWVVPLASMMRTRSAPATGAKRSLRETDPKRHDWWWVAWFGLHVSWVALFLTGLDRINAATVGEPGALAEAIFACRAMITLELLVLAVLAAGFGIVNLQMRQLFFSLTPAEPTMQQDGPAMQAIPPRRDRRWTIGRPKERRQEAIPQSDRPTPSAAHQNEPDTTGETDLVHGLYAAINREIAAGQIDPQLWALAANADDKDDAAARTRYIRLRAEQIAQSAHGDAYPSGRPSGGPPRRVDVEA